MKPRIEIKPKSRFLRLIILFTLQFFIFNFSFLIVFSQPLVHEEWVARYERTPGFQVMGPFFALDKYGNSYVAGDNVVNDTEYILVVKYNTSGIQQWATLYKYPGYGYFWPAAIALDTFGNVYVTAQYGQTFLSPLNILTVKFNNSNGSVVWAKTYTGQFSWADPEDIKIDRLNNIYVVGQSDSALVCIKYNTNGDTVWVRKWHPQGDKAVGHACTIDDSLNIVITGERDHCLTFPPPGFCFDTLLTLKYSIDGVLRWVKTYFYPVNPSISFGIRATNDQFGNIYVIGRTRNSTGFYIYLTLKYNWNGNLQWASLYDGPGYADDFIKSIALDEIHNFVFVTGGIPGYNNRGECATIKYSALTGDSVWVKRDTGIYSNGGATDIKIDSTGNAYVVGDTYNVGSGAPMDILTIKYSQQGNLVWMTTYNGLANGLDIGRALEKDNLNNIYVCGTSAGILYQEGDYVVIKYSQLIGIKKISNNIAESFVLQQNFPNPFNSITKIRFSIANKSFVILKVYDVLGKLKDLLINQEVLPSEYELTFDGSSYSSDVYFYQLIADDKIIDCKKLVILK